MVRKKDGLEIKANITFVCVVASKEKQTRET